MKIALIILALIIAVSWLASEMERWKREMLMDKYGDAEIVSRIMLKKIWIGMTREQLIDSWGEPSDNAQKVYKTKTTDTLKYNPIGKNRYQNRVMIEEDVVVGWDMK